MDVVVVGGHGKVALALLQILAQRGDRARGLIRERAQAPDLEAVGAEAMIADLERDEIPRRSATLTRWYSPPVRAPGVVPSASAR